jgi:hypothetical protein
LYLCPIILKKEVGRVRPSLGDLPAIESEVTTEVDVILDSAMIEEVIETENFLVEGIAAGGDRTETELPEIEISVSVALVVLPQRDLLGIVLRKGLSVIDPRNDLSVGEEARRRAVAAGTLFPPEVVKMVADGASLREAPEDPILVVIVTVIVAVEVKKVAGENVKHQLFYLGILPSVPSF